MYRDVQQDDFAVQSLLAKNNVEIVCTTDDPTDTLEYHKQFATQESSFRMVPTFRPDKSFAVENVETYRAYIEKLAKAAGTSINSFDDLIQALQNRVNVFHQMGCRASDHGLEQLYFHPESEQRAPSIFSKLLAGKSIGCRGSYDLQERRAYQCQPNVS